MTLQTDLQSAVQKIQAASDLIHAIANGPAGVTVTTENGEVKTAAEAIAGIGNTINQALKDLSNVSNAHFQAKGLAAGFMAGGNNLAELTDAGAAVANLGLAKRLLSDATATLSVSYPTAVNSYGNTTDNPVIDLTKTFLTSMTNNGNGVITADKVNNNSVDVWVTNNQSAGTLDISSFDYVKGSFGVGDGVITIMHMSTVNGVARVALEVLA